MYKWTKAAGFIKDFHNRTILFKIGNYIFVTYGAFVGLAFFAGLSMALYYNSITGFNVDQLIIFYLFILLPAIFIGIRLHSIIEMLLDNKKFSFSIKNVIEFIYKPGFNLQGGILASFITII